MSDFGFKTLLEDLDWLNVTFAMSGDVTPLKSAELQLYTKGYTPEMTEIYVPKEYLTPSHITVTRQGVLFLFTSESRDGSAFYVGLDRFKLYRHFEDLAEALWENAPSDRTLSEIDDQVIHHLRTKPALMQTIRDDLTYRMSTEFKAEKAAKAALTREEFYSEKDDWGSF